MQCGLPLSSLQFILPTRTHAEKLGKVYMVPIKMEALSGHLTQVHSKEVIHTLFLGVPETEVRTLFSQSRGGVS